MYILFIYKMIFFSLCKRTRRQKFLVFSKNKKAHYKVFMLSYWYRLTNDSLNLRHYQLQSISLFHPLLLFLPLFLRFFLSLDIYAICIEAMRKINVLYLIERTFPLILTLFYLLPNQHTGDGEHTGDYSVVSESPKSGVFFFFFYSVQYQYKHQFHQISDILNFQNLIRLKALFFACV